MFRTSLLCLVLALSLLSLPAWVPLAACAQGPSPAQVLQHTPHLLGITAATPQLKSGKTVKLTLWLSHPAPKGGLTISLSSSHPKVLTLPKTITIPAGAKKMGLHVPIGALKSDTNIILTGAHAGITKQTALHVKAKGEKE